MAIKKQIIMEKNCQKENIKGATINLYDMSLLIGVEYMDLIKKHYIA